MILKNIFKTAAVMGGGALLFTVCANSMAADWTIRQGSTVTTTQANLQQGNTSLVTGSTQAINGIALEDEDDLAAESVQSVRLTMTLPFRMVQGGHVDQAKQALNYIRAQNIGVSDGADVLQSVTTSAQETSLTQIVSGLGNQNNLQAMNAAEAANLVRKLRQTSTVNGPLKLFQNEVITSPNTQAVNYALGATIGHQVSSTVKQEVTVQGANSSTAFSQSASGGRNVQAGNIAIATESGINAATQTFDTIALELEQNVDVSGTNTQAVNYAKTDSGSIEEFSQTVTATGVTEFKNNSVSADNIQAGNLAVSADSIIGLTQRFTASASSFLGFTQEGSGGSNIQAGNMARLTGDPGATMSNINQHFTGSSRANAFRQTTAAADLIQAANLLDVGTGSLDDDTGPHQNFTVPGGFQMSMVQNSGTSNLQALNAMVYDGTGANADSEIHQSLNVRGLDFQMEQNGVMNSGQFGNFAGDPTTL